MASVLTVSGGQTSLRRSSTTLAHARRIHSGSTAHERLALMARQPNHPRLSPRTCGRGGEGKAPELDETSSSSDTRRQLRT